MSYLPEQILIVYGSLAPGRTNYHKISMIDGEWRKGIIRGRLEKRGWGSALGYPGFINSEDQKQIEVDILFSTQLIHFWELLDEFEGNEYRRIIIPFQLNNGERGTGSIYALKE